MSRRAEEHYLALLSATGWGARLLRLPLIALSQLYSLAGSIRNILFDKGLKKIGRVDIPVISVGNITAGGGGKTPLACHLVDYFLARSITPAVISRGYGAPSGELNDEALLIKQRYGNIPVFCHPKRIIAARRAQEAGAQIIIADDAFGHRQLHRDLDILILPPHNPWGFGRTFPAGLLREKLRGLARADIIISQSPRDEISPTLTRYSSAPLFSAHKQATTTRSLSDGSPAPQLKRALLACGIAQPQSFIDSARAAGVEVIDCIPFDDHHHFSAADAKKLREAAGEAPLLVTEKDAAKLKTLTDQLPPTYVLPIELSFDDPQGFESALMAQLRAKADF